MKLPFELKGSMLLSANTFLILILAFPVQVLIARYLGPTALGSYAYVLSFASLARTCVALGLQDVLIPMFKAEGDDSLFGTALLMRKAASVLLLGVALGWLVVCELQGSQADAELSLMLLVVVSAHLFSDHEIFSIWCKCEGRLTSFVAVDLGGTLAGLSLRLSIVAFQGSMIMLLASYVAEQFAKLVISLALYLKQARPFLKPFRCRRSDAVRIGIQAWPIWLGALLTVAYTRIDQILLGSLLPDITELGQYSVAVRLTEALSAGALALFVVYLPLLSSSSAELFDEHLQRMHDLALLGSLALAVPLFYALEPIVLLMYGARYSVAAGLAGLYLLVLPTLYIAFCRAAYLYSRGLQKLELGIKVLSVCASLGLNLLLIPRFGALGALGTALCVQWSVTLIPCLVLSELRPLLRCLVRSALVHQSVSRLGAWIRS